MAKINTQYQKWVNSPLVDEKTKAELEAIKNDEREIDERFYKALEFGTGGLRGIIGAGCNRMNVYTVRQATQGLADYINSAGKSDMGVCVSYDSRLYSDVFAIEAASVLAGNGIKVYLSDELRPVPFLSYSVIERQAAAGIMITASHNPAKYNGFKVYCETGEQLSLELADEISRLISETDVFEGVKSITMDEAKNKGLLQMMGEETEDKFLSKVLEQSINNMAGSDLKIVYTPFHGSGNKPVRRALSKAGYKNVYVVREQELPDPNFSTVKSPNPEEKEGFYLAEVLGIEKQADILIGTDPDCDRLGVMIKDKNGYTSLSGNEIGVILMYYILSNKKLPQNGAVVKTIVSTYLANVIGEDFGMKVFDVLTGFKFIGEKIREFESDNSYEFVFGFEESYGYLSGSYTRDKDGVVASLLICEAAAFYKMRGMTLPDALSEIYAKYGTYKEGLVSITMEGKEGLSKIAAITQELRVNPPDCIGGEKVVALYDYETSEMVDYISGARTALTLPSSNVLKFELADKSTFAVRPSGTEPKIKIYFAVSDKTAELAEARMQKLIDGVNEFLPLK